MFRAIANYFKKRSFVLGNPGRFRFENLCSTHFFVMNLKALWPWRPHFFWGKLWTLIILLLSVPVCLQLKEIYDSLESVDHFTRILAVSMQQTFGPIRNISLHIKRDSLMKVREILRSDYFQPRNKRHFEIIDGAISNMYLFCSVFVSTLTACLIAEHLTVLLVSTEEFPLSYDIWIPYDYKRPYLYQFTYIYTSFLLVYTCALISSVNLNFLDVVIFIGAQCEMIAYDLDNLEENARNEAAVAGKLGDEAFFEESCMEKLRRSIITYQLLLQLRKHVTEAHFINISIYFSFHFIIMCTSMFQIIVAIDTGDLGRFFTYLTYQLFAFNQLFFWSWFCNSVQSQSVKIFYSLYNLNWMERSREFKINLRFFMLCTKEPIEFSIGGLAAISLSLFLLMLKWDYAYIQLLRALYIR